MRQKTVMAGLCGAFLGLASVSAASAAPPRVDRLCGPHGLELGMSIEAWKGLGFSTAGQRVLQPICSDDPAAAKYLGVKVSAAPADPIVCGYADRIGSFFLEDTVNLVGGYPARRLRYYFQAGGLSRVDCIASDDTFDALQARFDKLYGPSKVMLRDQVHTEVGARPRIKERWSIPGGSVTLVDPVKPANDLSLEYRSGPG